MYVINKTLLIGQDKNIAQGLPSYRKSIIKKVVQSQKVFHNGHFNKKMNFFTFCLKV